MSVPVPVPVRSSQEGVYIYRYIERTSPQACPKVVGGETGGSAGGEEEH